jgi:aryl-alcohol dehydrogenase-like predicted oxidoreductase
MTYRQLGRSGLHLSTVGLGCNDELRAAVAEAAPGPP